MVWVMCCRQQQQNRCSARPLKQNGNCCVSFFFDCIFVDCSPFFSPLVFCSSFNQMAGAKTAEDQTKGLVEPATLFVQYRLRNVVKKSLRLPALFLLTLQTNPVHFTMFLSNAPQSTSEEGCVTRQPAKC